MTALMSISSGTDGADGEWRPLLWRLHTRNAAQAVAISVTLTPKH
jgi:hypothetical protein